MTDPSKALTLPLKGEYFDQIKAGTKPEEYRMATDFWAARIAGRTYDTIVLTRGYPKGGGIEGVSRLTRQWRGYQVRTTTPAFRRRSRRGFRNRRVQPLLPLYRCGMSGNGPSTAKEGESRP